MNISRNIFKDKIEIRDLSANQNYILCNWMNTQIIQSRLKYFLMCVYC